MSEFFAGNRARLRRSAGGDPPIVVTANGLVQAGADSPLPFKQDASFWYLTGIDEPDVVLVMDGAGEYLIVPERDAVRVAFDGAISDEALSRRSGIATILGETAGWKRLEKAVKQTKHVATLAAAPARMERFGMYANPARAALIQKLTDMRSGLEAIDLRERLAELRCVKQEPELTALQQAIDVTVAGMQYVSSSNRLPSYTFEYEIEADLAREFRRRGASGHAFAPIVASGKRAATLHNTANNGALTTGDLLVLDVGAEVEQYDADITRTIALGQPTKRQQAIYDAVCAVQDFALSLLKPSVAITDYEQQVEQYMGEQLRQLGLIKKVAREDIRKFYPHATSHFLGLDTHDVGDYRRPLEPGMVLTCEPGMYIPEESIGIRIEDDILITPDGNRNLSARLPRRLA